MVALVSSLRMFGHSCLNPCISTELSSIRCKYSNIFQMRTGNKLWGGGLCRIPQISIGKSILIFTYSQDSYAKKYYLSFAQSTVKIQRLQDLLTATQDVSYTVKFQKTSQKSSQWKLKDAWFIEDCILLLFHYLGSPQKCRQSLWKQSLSQLHFPLLYL